MSSAITSEELRAALTAFVNEDPDVFWGKKHPKPSLKQAAKVHARGSHSSVTRYFNKRILPIEGLTPEETKSKRLAEIDNLMLLPRGNPDLSGKPSSRIRTLTRRRRRKRRRRRGGWR
jgi:hypothetical protein